MYWFARSLLVAATVASLAVIGAAFYAIGARQNETWAVLAAALAVLTSVVASWGSHRVLELQQEERKPYPYPSVDVAGRYSLLQLRITNFGGGTARDVRLVWDRPLLNSAGEQVRFTLQEGAPDVPVLLPRESVAVLIDGHVQFYQTYAQNADYSGWVEYSDTSGRRARHAFFVSAEKYRKSLTYDQEALKTHYQLQQIPDKLEELASEVAEFRKVIGELLANHRAVPGNLTAAQPGAAADGAIDSAPGRFGEKK